MSAPIDGPYRPAWPDYFDLVVDIHWEEPVPYEALFSGEASGIDTAWFYTIVACSQGEWWTYYIGMTEYQDVARRLRNQDHLRRRQQLQEDYPELEFLVSLGTPTFLRGGQIANRIHLVEGLLIYCNWHEDMANTQKVQAFNSPYHIAIHSSGWNRHLEPEIAFGVFYQGARRKRPEPRKKRKPAAAAS